MANYSNLSEEELRKLFNVTKTPEQIAGQYANAGNSVMQLAAPQAPQAPQNSNVSFDFSGQPTPQAPQAQAPAISDAEELERYRQRRLENPLQVEARPQVKGTYSPMGGVSVPSENNYKWEGSVPQKAIELAKNSVTPAWKQRQADTLIVNPFNGESMPYSDNPFPVPEAANPFAGMTLEQMGLAKAQEKAQLEQKSQPIAKSDPIAAAGAAPQAPTQPNSFATSQGAATTVGGTPLSEFLSGKALPEQGLMRAENPMYGDNSLSRGLGGDAATQAFQDASAAREARIEQNFGISRGPDSRDGEDASGAPTALFKKQAEAEGLTGRAKSEYVQEKTRMWGEQKEDRATAKSSAVAEAARKKIELGLKISEDEREIVKADDEKREKKNITAAAIQGAMENLRLMEGVSEEIKGLTFKSLTEGNFARAASLISPTSTSAQIDRLTETLSGDAFVDSILELKRMGGTVGQVSNEEGKKLTAAKQKLMTTGMSDLERRKAVDLYLKTKQTSVQNLYNAYVRDFGPEAAKEAFGGSSFTGKSATQPKYANDVDHGGPVDSYLMEKSK